MYTESLESVWRFSAVLGVCAIRGHVHSEDALNVRLGLNDCVAATEELMEAKKKSLLNEHQWLRLRDVLLILRDNSAELSQRLRSGSVERTKTVSTETYVRLLEDLLVIALHAETLFAEFTRATS